MMKRERDRDGSSIEDNTLEVAKCLIQISNRSWGAKESSNNGVERMFNCKTCGRAFTSFQALGGHRASHHKKPKLMTSTSEDITEEVKVKVKSVHQCSICGIKFGLGQALGGHMRRHRVETKGDVADDRHAMSFEDARVAAGLVPSLMRSLSMNRRVMCMDLNLTPLENDLQLLFGKKAPRVDCKLVV